MPNHCETDLYIRGPQEKVDEFAKWLEEIEPLGRDICRALIPYPEPYKTMDEEARVFAWNSDEKDAEKREAARDAYRTKYGHTMDGYNSGGHGWCCQTWGTKWGTYDVDFDPHSRRGALLTFQSAWSPPSEAVFRALVEKFPDLSFEAEWFEGGAAYCGGMTLYSKNECEAYECEFGVPTSQWSGEYSGSRGG